MSKGMQMSTTLQIFVFSWSATLMSRGTQMSTILHVLLSVSQITISGLL